MHNPTWSIGKGIYMYIYIYTYSFRYFYLYPWDLKAQSRSPLHLCSLLLSSQWQAFLLEETRGIFLVQVIAELNDTGTSRERKASITDGVRGKHLLKPYRIYFHRFPAKKGGASVISGGAVAYTLPNEGNQGCPAVPQLWTRHCANRTWHRRRYPRRPGRYRLFRGLVRGPRHEVRASAPISVRKKIASFGGATSSGRWWSAGRFWARLSLSSGRGRWAADTLIQHSLYRLWIDCSR